MEGNENPISGFSQELQQKSHDRGRLTKSYQKTVQGTVKDTRSEGPEPFTESNGPLEK